MDTTGPQVAPRRPQARAQRNFESLLDAGVALLAEQGWAAFNRNQMAKRVGLSYRPVFDRFPDRIEMAAVVWRERLAEPMIAVLERVVDGAGLGTHPSDERRFVAAMADLAQPTQPLHAAAELLVIASYHPLLMAAIRADLGARLQAWCGAEVPSSLAARRAYLTAVGFGLLLLARYPAADRLDLTDLMRGLLLPLHRPAVAQPLPPEPVESFDAPAALAPDDPALDALLQATLRVVAAKGFQEATVQDVAREAGFTGGLVFSRYAGKLDLFLDATARQAALRLRENALQAAALAERTERAVAEAVMIRELQRPGREAIRALGLEQLRLTWHEPRLREIVAAEIASHFAPGELGQSRAPHTLAHAEWHLGIALSFGMALLGQLHDGAHALPYDVVTRAMFPA
jgi:AcrR family transcriptional regulator